VARERPSRPCALPGACASNVLFLPGIEASRLYRPDYAGGTDQLWEPYGDADGADLVLNPDGTATREDVYTKDVIDNAYVPIKGNVYKSFISSMDEMRSDDLINDWSAAPYDWRLSLDDILNGGRRFPDGRIYYSGPNAATSSPYIIQELRRLATSSKTGKVTIVAHSNGGLLAKRLTELLGPTESARLIDKLIFVAVPQVGTPQAIGAILHGYDQGLPVSWFPAALSASEARSLAANMSSAYNLLPSGDYFTQVDDPVITIDHDPLLAPWRARYGDTIHSAELLHTFFTDQSREVLPTNDALKSPIVANESLLDKAETAHSTQLDNWTPPAGIALTEIAGWGEETLKTIIYYQGMMSTCTSYRADSTCAAIVETPSLEYKVKTVLDGDGTVVVPSALWTTGAERYWMNLKSYNGRVRINPEKHHNILEVDPLRTFIKNIIRGDIGALSQYDFISTSTPQNDNPETRLHFTLHSPLTLDLYDDLGNHTGISTTTSFLEENVPGSRYKTFGELKYISVPSSIHAHILIRGYATGSFTLDVEETQGSVITASTTFAGIPSSATTIATLTIPQGGGIANSSPLAIDENGDGHTDIMLAPKEGGVALPDITPPEAVLVFSTTTDDVLVFGRDEGQVSVSPSSSLATSTLQYVLADDSGNTTTLAFKRIKEKESKNERHGHIKARLLSIAYGTLSTTTESIFSENEIQYEWKRNKNGSLKEFEQKIKVKKDFKIRAKYDAKKNTTKIYFVDKENKEKLKETKAGLVLIRIATKEGELVAEY
jgi:pimeloyl-ACP methyl ester carboxylesterase